MNGIKIDSKSVWKWSEDNLIIERKKLPVLIIRNFKLSSHERFTMTVQFSPNPESKNIRRYCLIQNPNEIMTR